MTDERPGERAIGLRGRLAASIAVILLAALAVTFVAVYRGTGSDLRGRIDDDLEQEARSLALRLAGAAPAGPRAVRARAVRLIAAQPFGPSAQVLAITVPGAGIATNQPELLGLEPEGEEERADRGAEGEDARGILATDPGFTTVNIEEAGDVRLLTRPVARNGQAVATVRAGEPLESVDRALEGLSRTFLIVGSITLLLGAGAGYLLAARTARPLRRMSQVAGKIDAGELSLRMQASGPRDEVRRLAESFNHMLERLEDAFSRQRSFVSDASHELRTPLTVVRGQLEVLARQPEPQAEDIERVSAQVSAAVARMERLVDDLLLLARTDEGIKLRRDSVALEPLLRDQLEGFEAVADRSFQLGQVPEGRVLIDEDRIGQVVSNLLVNAVEHTDDGGTISVSAESRGDRVAVSVDDDGPGIPEAERMRVFDRLHRTDSSRSRRAGGSGLGLAIARALVEAHGGAIRATASPLGGARIEFELPGFGA